MWNYHKFGTVKRAEMTIIISFTLGVVFGFGIFSLFNIAKKADKEDT